MFFKVLETFFINNMKYQYFKKVLTKNIWQILRFLFDSTMLINKQFKI